MKATLYLSALLLCGLYAHAQQTERPDTEQPAVTVADVEQDAKEATDQRKAYEAEKDAEKEKAVANNSNTTKPEQDTDTKSIYTSTRKSSNKPEKQ